MINVEKKKREKIYRERVKLVGEGKDINDAERLRKQLCSMRKLIEVIAEQPNDKQTSTIHMIGGQIGCKVCD